MAKRVTQSPYGYSPSAWRMIGRGMEVGAIIGGLTYMGYLGDERFGTGPWLTLTGAVLATVGGSYNLAKDMLYPRKPKRSGAEPPNDTDGRSDSA